MSKHIHLVTLHIGGDSFIAAASTAGSTAELRKEGFSITTYKCELPPPDNPLRDKTMAMCGRLLTESCEKQEQGNSEGSEGLE